MKPRYLIFSLLLIALAAGRAQAEDWPSRPITLVHIFAAGGIVGTVYVAKSAPDGYTLLNTAIGPAVLNQLLFKTVPYDTQKDFTPIILVGEIPQLIVSSPKLGFKTLQDLIDYGRKIPAS